MNDRESQPLGPERDRSRSAVAAPARDGVGPIALLLPVAFALLTFAFLRGRLSKEPEGPRAVPPSATQHEEVAGWAGELAAPQADTELDGVDSAQASGPRLVASLRPLQSNPERQAFDAAALGKRLGFETGQPWRLELRYRQASEEVLLQPLAVRDFSEITVFDEHGPALGPIAQQSRMDGSDTIDPLRVLCSAPEIPLRPGYEVTVFLWGRRPQGTLRLEGLAGGPFEAARAMTLIPRSLPAQPLHESLAQLERIENR